MKKIMGLFVTLCMLAGMTCNSYALFVDSDAVGMSFEISDEWVEGTGIDGYIIYQNLTTEDDLKIYRFESEFGYESVYDNRDYCRQVAKDVILTDENLSEELSGINDVYVTIHEQSVYEDVIVRGGKPYYGFEKKYIASAPGYNDTALCDTVLMTLQNGYLFVFHYETDDSVGWDDVMHVLDTASYAKSEITININDEKIKPDSAPVIIDGRTLVPIRAIAEKMGYTVTWEADAEIVQIESADGENILHFQIGTDYYLKNYIDEISLDVAPVIIGSRTYLPVRAVAEAMDAKVSWYGSTRTVDIRY